MNATSQAASGMERAGPCSAKPLDKRCVACILDESEYFSGLPTPAKRALQEGLQRRAYERREILYREGGANDYLYILMTGEVKVYKSTADGRQQIHKVASIPGDLIGCEDLFLDAAGSTAEAIVDTSVCGMERRFLHAATQRDAAISETLMRAMARNLNAYIRHIANLGTKTALERVASYLVFQNKTHAHRKAMLGLLPESLTRLEMAEMLGITQRTLIRSLKDLESLKVLRLARDGYEICDPERLSRLAEGG